MGRSRLRAYREIEEMKTASVNDAIQQCGWVSEERSWGILDDGWRIGKKSWIQLDMEVEQRQVLHKNNKFEKRFREGRYGLNTL